MGVCDSSLADPLSTISRQTVRRALRALDLVERLGQNPLAQLQVVTIRRQRQGYLASVSGQGIALREVVLDAIDALKPDDGAPQPSDKRWRPYLILLMQYIERRSPTSVADFLNIERTTYNHSQAHALDMLRDVLLQWEYQQQRAASAAPETGPSSSVPAPLTPLIGREQLVSALSDMLLADDIRLLTLTGLPGVGKTRLGVAVAAALLPCFNDGVFFISLGAITDVRLVSSVIAYTLGIAERPGQAMDQTLAQALHDTHCLLIIDNFEHLLSATALVHALLLSCPWLKMLITSRAVLRVQGEHVVVVPPLALPDLASATTWAELVQFPSVTLFIDRVQTIMPEFTVTAESVHIIVEICRQLEGIPLAIELAAPHVRFFSLEIVLSRLAKRLDVLTSGGRDLPARQQSLQHAIDWSYNLLSTQAQQLLQCLGVFADGATLSAIEAICSASDQCHQDIIASLSVLFEHSFIRRYQTHDDTPRFTMLDTIREYALGRLLERGQVEGVCRQHAFYYLELVEAAEPHFIGAEQHVWLKQLARDYDNIRVALYWALHQDERVILARLCGVLWRFWNIHGHIAEGRWWLDQALACDALAPDVHARVLYGAGLLASIQDDYGSARAFLETGLALCHAVDNYALAAQTLVTLGQVDLWQGDYPQAIAHLEAGLALSKAINDTHGVAVVLKNLGLTSLYQDDVIHASACFQQSLRLFDALGNQLGIAMVLNFQGRAALFERDSVQAVHLLEASLAILQELEHTPAIARTCMYLGSAALMQHQPEQALQLLLRSLELFQYVGDKEGGVTAIEMLAEVYLAIGQLSQAARLLGAAEAARQAIGIPRPPLIALSYDQTVAQVQSLLETSLFSTVWAEGQTLSLEQPIVYALAQVGQERSRTV